MWFILSKFCAAVALPSFAECTELYETLEREIARAEATDCTHSLELHVRDSIWLICSGMQSTDSKAALHYAQDCDFLSGVYRTHP